jgi:hypothetical protein
MRECRGDKSPSAGLRVSLVEVMLMVFSFPMTFVDIGIKELRWGRGCTFFP